MLVSWPALDVAVRCTLLDDINPQLCASLRRALPIVSVQTHAVVAGEQIYFPTRLVLDEPDAARTEDLSAQPPGRINFEPFFQYLSLNYGPVSERVPAWPVAQVVAEDLPRLPGVGERIWQNLLHEDHAVHVVVSEGDVPASIPVAEARAFAPPEATSTTTELIGFLAAEIDRIWLVEPRDAQALRTGRAATHAGVGRQYFSPWVMATGLVRGLAVVDLPALRRSVSSERLGARAAAEFLAELLRVPAGVIGYFGLPELGAVLEVVRASCQRFGDRAELLRLLDAFSTYSNRYNLWLHQGFPWRLGDGFRRE